MRARAVVPDMPAPWAGVVSQGEIAAVVQEVVTRGGLEHYQLARAELCLSYAAVGAMMAGLASHLCNKSGPALYANRLQVGQAVNLRNWFTATSGKRDPADRAPADLDPGAVHLTGAHIGGSLHCAWGHVSNESGSALVADSLQTGRGIYLHNGFTAMSSGDDGVAIKLVRAQAGGALFFDEAAPQHTTDSTRRLEVDGLTYAGVPEEVSAEHWRELLREGTPRYAAQPYQHLATGYRALGNNQEVRETLWAQRDDQLHCVKTSRRGRLWGWITKKTLGYGYKPWRALWFLFGVVAVSCVLAWLLGSLGALEQTKDSGAPGDSCSPVQELSVGLDLNLPVGHSLAREQCALAIDPANVTARLLTVAGWVLQVLAWVFAALFIAGFTSAVRKT